MMKKLSRIAALLAAGALLFGAIGCSSGSSGGGGGEDPKEKEDAKTSTWEFSDLQGVAANIKVTGEELIGTVDAAAINAATKSSLTAFPTHSASGDMLEKFYILDDVEYPATEGDKTMTILARPGDGTDYNFHNRYYGLYTASSINVDHSKGTLEIKGDALSIADVQGPFSVTVVSTVNGSSDRNDRYAFIKTGTTLATAIAGSPVKQAEASKASGDKLTYTYEGTDKLTVVIGAGGSGSIRVFDVEVTEYESAEDIEDPAAGPGDGEDDEDEEEDEDPVEVETKNVYTEYFDGKANIYSGATFSGIFAGGDLATDTNGKTKTYEFTSGVKWVPGTGGKIEKDKVQIFGDYTSKSRLALDKASNSAALTVPVMGACTVVLGFQNNSNSRGFTVESQSATLSNENVASYDSGTKQGSADAIIESGNSGKTLTLKITGNGITSKNELVSFDVSDKDTLTIKATDGVKDNGEASAGTVYIYFIDVKAKD